MTGVVQTIAVGKPRSVTWNGGEVQTSIFKTPVTGPVWVRRHNLEDPANFGENLTLRGLDEAKVALGDVFRIVEKLSPGGG